MPKDRSESARARTNAPGTRMRGVATLLEHALVVLVDEALEALDGVVRRPGDAIEPGLVYVGTLRNVLGERNGVTPEHFHLVEADTIVLRRPARRSFKRPR